MNTHLRTNNSFYFEALHGITKLETGKHYETLNEEHLFYNPIFITTADGDMHERTLTPFYKNKSLQAIKTYGDLLNKTNTRSINAVLARKKESIHYIRESFPENQVVSKDNKVQVFRQITQKFIYSCLLLEKSKDHSYQTKWDEEVNSQW